MKNLFNCIIQEENAFYINFWVKALAFVLYSDLFFSLTKIPISTIDFNLFINPLNIFYVMIFIIGAIITIGIMAILIALIECIYLIYEERLSSNQSRREKPEISAHMLKEYAILKNNQVAYNQAVLMEKHFVDSRIQVGVLILLLIDVFYGCLADIMQSYFADSTILYKIGILITLLFIINWRVSLLNEPSYIELFPILRKKIL